MKIALKFWNAFLVAAVVFGSANVLQAQRAEEMMTESSDPVVEEVFLDGGSPEDANVRKQSLALRTYQRS